MVTKTFLERAHTHAENPHPPFATARSVRESSVLCVRSAGRDLSRTAHCLMEGNFSYFGVGGNK